MSFCISPICKVWLGGLISAFSGAIPPAVGTMIIDPSTFNFKGGFSNVLIVAGLAAGMAVLNYLKQSPLPGVTPPKIEDRSESIKIKDGLDD